MTSRLEATLRLLRLELQRAMAGPPLRGNVALFGSSTMELEGLARDPSDVDLAVRPWVFGYLRKRNWGEMTGDDPSHPAFLEWRDQPSRRLTVHAFYAWRSDQPEIDLTEVLDCAVIAANGWPMAPLSILRSQKECSLEHGYAAVGSRDLAGSRWEKHQRDLVLIDEWIASKPTRTAA
jgi:hypothetical protein